MNTRPPREKFSEWIEWSGGKNPVPDFHRPEVRYRSGGTAEVQAGTARWSHEGRRDDIMAYRRYIPVMPGFCP